jgi:hypothetical protein
MKKIVVGTLMLVAASGAFAEDSKGPGCGWGTMLWDGKTGKPAHVMGATTNMTSGNATFGMSSGTNGCDASTTIHYGGTPLFAMHNMDGLAQDIAKGDGETLSTYASIMNIEPQDMAHFKSALQANYVEIYPASGTTSDQVVASIESIMAKDETLAKYV